MSARKGFTLLELLMAVMLLGMMSVISIVTFRAVTNGWRVSREYMDRLERTDFALDQLVSAIKCAYYPHNGEQSYDYGFQLDDRGDGENPRDSDIITWTKKGAALVGANAAADALHRIEVRVLEEGDNSWGTHIERTGLYARVKPMAPVMKTSSSRRDESEYSLASDELYRPFLIAKDVDGFDCKVQPTKPTEEKKEEDASAFEDVFEASNSVPYKVQLTFYMPKEDPEYASRKIRIPLMRIISIPVHQQSLDGSQLPGADDKNSGGKRGGTQTGGGRR